MAWDRKGPWEQHVYGRGNPDSNLPDTDWMTEPFILMEPYFPEPFRLGDHMSFMQFRNLFEC